MTPPSQAPPADLVKAVRAANAAGDGEEAAALVDEARADNGPTPTVLVAQSWVGRGALAAGDLDKAEAVGHQTYAEAQALLRTRGLDDDAELPLALGASIELLANVAVARGARSEALAYLQRELDTWADTSMAMRLQKNINLLSLTGTPTPPLATEEPLGEPLPTLAALRGRVVLLFFWAHWCSDCKRQGPVLEALVDRYGADGLTVIAPTRRYGYVAGGQDAAPADEARYIEEVWREAYAGLAGTPVALDEANHARYGVSTTPTLVLVDREGIVRLYHPGQMTEEALAPLVEQALAQGPPPTK
jgi:thiol-disulfide isomerase/thioredoxin